MNFTTYQQLAYRTASRDGDLEKRQLIAALGLAGEAGEVAELIKKQIGHHHPLNSAAIAKELGDALWYIACVATLYDLDLTQIATENIDKLRQRYPEGFTSTDSLERRDVVTQAGSL